MRRIEYNCGYEELLAISFMNIPMEEKIGLAQKGVGFFQVKEMLGGKLSKIWDRELEWCNEDADEQIRRGHIFYGEEDYPSSLAAASDPPFRIAWKGNKPIGGEGSFKHAESVTIVGTRQADLEGRRAAYLLALECAKNGIAVYSGYASGIDQCSHLGASDGDAANFAIMPCGLAHSYAYREPSLAAKIYANGGGFVSGFCCDEEPYKWNFHLRNRLLSQITDATVVVQAPKSSGALITVTCALDCGKDVFVHQAGTGVEKCREGTQGLVNDGAITISGLQDLSLHTFNAFRCEKVVQELSFDEIRSYIAGGGGTVYRYGDKYYRFKKTAEKSS